MSINDGTLSEPVTVRRSAFTPVDRFIMRFGFPGIMAAVVVIGVLTAAAALVTFVISGAIDPSEGSTTGLFWLRFANG